MNFLQFYKRKDTVGCPFLMARIKGENRTKETLNKYNGLCFLLYIFEKYGIIQIDK